MRLLIVEDEQDLAASLARDFTAAGFAVDQVHDGVEAQFHGEVEPYDVVVLDLGLPGRPGLDVLKAWRAAGRDFPVVVLTARDAWHEKVDGFNAGADDYLGKPFRFEELHARVQAVLRRSSGRASAELTAGGLRLDEERQEVWLPDGACHPLTGTEFRLLRYLMTHPGRILSKTQLTEHVYEGDFDRDSNLIEVYVRRLRDKIGRDRIETRRGQGYVFTEPAADP